jgi:integrase/recombinase XerD
MNRSTQPSSSSLTVLRNPDLARHFQEKQERKLLIDDFVNDFLCQFVSHDTKIAYIKDLKFFFDFLRTGDVIVTHPNQVQAYHFQAYRDQMLKEKKASATIARRLVSIRSFMKWSVAAGYVSFNPLDQVKLPKVQTEQETIAFDDAEAIRMIAAPDTSNHRGRTHRLSMVLLFNLGLRRNELVNLKLQDVYEERGHIVLRIHGKGGKIRTIPLSEYVQKEIDKYTKAFNESAKKGLKLEGPDFLLQTHDCQKNGSPINGSTIYRIINRTAKSLGINKRVSPHSCRATVISHLLDTQGRAIRDVADFAGHSNIGTTERYDKRRNALDFSAAYSVGLTDEAEEGRVG